MTCNTTVGYCEIEEIAALTLEMYIADCWEVPDDNGEIFFPVCPDYIGDDCSPDIKGLFESRGGLKLYEACKNAFQWHIAWDWVLEKGLDDLVSKNEVIAEFDIPF